MSQINEWNILVVEDEVDGQEVVQGMLGYFNIQTEVVGNAEDAIVHLENQSYTAVIIDLMLPGMDGVELVKRIRANRATADLPCIAITAYHTSAVKQNALNEGFDAFFAKPLDDTSFVRQVENIIRR